MKIKAVQLNNTIILSHCEHFERNEMSSWGRLLQSLINHHFWWITDVVKVTLWRRSKWHVLYGRQVPVVMEW